MAAGVGWAGVRVWGAGRRGASGWVTAGNERVTAGDKDDGGLCLSGVSRESPGVAVKQCTGKSS